MKRVGKAGGMVVGVGAAVIGVVTCSSPAASAQDGGVCARLNGAPFYIPPQGYMPQPGEVITGPVTAGPCKDTASTEQSQPSLPNLPSAPTSSPTSTTAPPPTP